jgi:hypothetical protein
VSQSIPRFAVVVVTIGGKRKFLAYDHLTKKVHYPVHASSQEEAQGLVVKLANEARARKEALSLPQNQAGNVQVQPPKP